jgi:hypothetical protein
MWLSFAPRLTGQDEARIDTRSRAEVRAAGSRSFPEPAGDLERRTGSPYTVVLPGAGYSEEGDDLLGPAVLNDPPMLPDDLCHEADGPSDE